uniref:Uncharacterized protein n=1 Tax=Kalanchoe fedtschenkoi TaxID=63787 RepID=A0A7N1A1R7_KALFE
MGLHVPGLDFRFCPWILISTRYQKIEQRERLLFVIFRCYLGLFGTHLCCAAARMSTPG